MTAAIACEGWVAGWCVLVAMLPLTGESYYWADEMAGVLIVVVAAADSASVEEECGGRNDGELLTGRRDED